MNIAVIGANGKTGSLVVKEALKRGHNVTAIVRDKNKVNKELSVIEKEIANLTKEDLEKFDVIVNAFGIWEESKFDLHSVYTKHLCDLLSGTPIRLIIVGGGGSLYVDSSHTTQAYDTPEFPDIYQSIARAAGKALAEVRKRDDVQWTYFSPPLEFDAEGIQTNSYIVGGEELIFNKDGRSYISYPDYAIALVDEIDTPKHIKKRFTVISE